MMVGSANRGEAPHRESAARVAPRPHPRRTRAYPDAGSTSARCRRREARPSVDGMENGETAKPSPVDVAQLLREIRRYLAAVDEFRRLGCGPRWRPEEVRS